MNWFMSLLLPYVFMASAASGQCPDGFNNWYRGGHWLNQDEFNSSCYKFEKNEMSWLRARKNCQKFGGDLVTIESSGENAHLIWIIKQNESLRNPGMTNYRGFGYWTGGNDLAVEGDWRWASNNTKFSFDGWDQGEPNNGYSGHENCLHLKKSSGWKWNDLICTEEFQGSICEIDGEY